MVFFFSILLVVSIFMFFWNFNKKLLCLLSLEMCFLSIIFISYLCSTSGNLMLLVFYLFLAFMVLDSVMGLTLLICCSRSMINNESEKLML